MLTRGGQRSEIPWYLGVCCWPQLSRGSPRPSRDGGAEEGDRCGGELVAQALIRATRAGRWWACLSVLRQGAWALRSLPAGRGYCAFGAALAVCFLRGYCPDLVELGACRDGLDGVV